MARVEPLQVMKLDGARLLIGALPAGERVVELEEAAPAAGGEPVVAVAPDDHFVLRKLLDEADSKGALPRTAPLLDDIELRPLARVDASERRLVAILPLSEPSAVLRPYHRGLRGVETFHPDRFLVIVRDFARIYELDAPLTTPAGLAAARERLGQLAGVGQHAVLLVLPGGDGRILRFRQRLEEVQIRAAPKNPTLRALDLALLESLVLKTVLGIDEPVPPKVEPVPSLEELVERVNAGELQAGFGLNPPPSWELRAVIEAHAKLPASTVRAPRLG